MKTSTPVYSNFDHFLRKSDKSSEEGETYRFGDNEKNSLLPLKTLYLRRDIFDVQNKGNKNLRQNELRS